MRKGALLLLLLTLCTACTDDPEPAAREEPASSTTTTTAVSPTPETPACAEEVAEGERLEGSAEGDVDGDGTVDEVFLVRSDSADPDCRNLLVVEGRGTTYIASTDDPEMPSALPQPRINHLAYVDDDPGAEIVVDLQAGASTQFVGLFKVADGALVRVRTGDRGLMGDLFPYGGSVGHIEASNCSEDDESHVVIAVATPRGPRYVVERTYYRIDGAELVEVRRDEERLPVEALTQEKDYVTSPFGSCVVNP